MNAVDLGESLLVPFALTHTHEEAAGRVVCSWINSIQNEGYRRRRRRRRRRLLCGAKPMKPLS